MKFTLKQLIFATVVFLLLDIAYLWIRTQYGLAGWVNPKTLTYWGKDLALVIAWGYYFWGKRKH